MVCLGHLRVHHQTGAQPTIIWASLVALLAVFVLLMIYIMNNQSAAAVALLVTLATSVIAEWAYRRQTGRRLHRLADASYSNGSHKAGKAWESNSSLAPLEL